MRHTPTCITAPNAPRNGSFHSPGRPLTTSNSANIQRLLSTIREPLPLCVGNITAWTTHRGLQLAHRPAGSSRRGSSSAREQGAGALRPEFAPTTAVMAETEADLPADWAAGARRTSRVNPSTTAPKMRAKMREIGHDSLGGAKFRLSRATSRARSEPRHARAPRQARGGLRSGTRAVGTTPVRDVWAPSERAAMHSRMWAALRRALSSHV
jgi:hypothetical protein